MILGRLEYCSFSDAKEATVPNAAANSDVRFKKSRRERVLVISIILNSS
jgi:hypothetical protein